MFRLVFLIVALLSASSVARADYASCTVDERAALETALSSAFDAISAATTSITPENGAYRSWFGVWDLARAKRVRTTLAALKQHIRVSKVTFFCSSVGENNCDADVYANVFPDDPSTVYICPLYFDLPELSTSTFLQVFESGTKAGTIIHEMTHFNVVGSTADNCYSRPVCMNYARTNPNGAIHNADSFQYFAEDAYLKQK